MTIIKALEKTKSTTFGQSKAIKLAEEKLGEDEKIELAITATVSIEPVIGKLGKQKVITKNNQTGILVITNKRIYFCWSLLGSRQYKEMLVSDIQSVDSYRDSMRLLAFTAVRICGITDMFVVNIANNKAQDLENVVSEVRRNYAKSVCGTVVQTDNISANLNDLRELKSLLDEGVITQEEFDAKKKQLLGI